MSRRLLLVFLLLFSMPHQVVAQTDPAIPNTPTPVPEAQIIVESDGYIPSFYEGRAEPTVGTTMFLTAATTLEAPEEYFYHWRINGLVTTPEPVKGLEQIAWPVPLTGAPQVAITITNRNGALVREGSKIVTLSEPEVQVYEVNPLYGTHPNTISDTTVLVGDEIVFLAVPYFFNPALTELTHAFEWKIDGLNKKSNLPNPLSIALERTTDEAGITQIDFSIRDVHQLVHQAKSNFTIVY